MKTSLSRHLRRWMAYGAAFAALAGLFAFLVVKSSPGFAASYGEVQTMLRDLKQIDAEWNVDVLRAKTGLSSNYDQVTSPLPVIDRLGGAIGGRGHGEWLRSLGEQPEIDRALKAYAELMKSKIALVERFKSQNAVLRNSTRYMPVAAADLDALVRASPALPDERRSLEGRASDLLAATLEYALTPEPGLRERVGAIGQDLARLGAAMAPEIAQSAQTLKAHSATVVAQQDIGTQLLGELSALQTARSIDRISDAYADVYNQLLADQAQHRLYLAAYAALLLLLVGYIGVRALRAYALLNRNHGELQALNQRLKESQVQMIQSEKMSALGRMVAGIAHEINTPLAYVRGTFELVRDQMRPVQEVVGRSAELVRLLRGSPGEVTAIQAALRIIEARVASLPGEGMFDDITMMLNDGVHGIDQISEIVMNLKNFSRLDRSRVADFSVEAGLDSTLTLANNLLKNGVEVIKHYGHVPVVNGSPSQINQVFLNLITNAAQAMAGREGRHVLTLRTSMEDDTTVKVEVEDNGGGIPQSLLSQIFDPFFTTKPIGQGSGMGLSISFKIIEDHGGSILVDSEEDVGTVFTVLLPVAGTARAMGAIAPDAEEPAVLADV